LKRVLIAKSSHADGAGAVTGDHPRESEKKLSFSGGVP